LYTDLWVELLIHSVPCETDLRSNLKLCSVGQYRKRETPTLPNLPRKCDYECGWPDHSARHNKPEDLDFSYLV